MKIIGLFIALTLYLPISFASIDTWTLKNSKTSIDAKIIPGKWNLVAIWALDCVACEQQKPQLSSFHSKYNNFNVVGVSIDGKSQLTGVLERLDKKPVSYDNYIVELDSFENQYEREYGTRFLVTPTYLLYSPIGELKGMQMGPIDFSELKKAIKPKKSISVDLMR